MPVGAKTHPPVAKAEPISNDGGASGVTDLRREKKLLCRSKLQLEKGVGIRESSVEGRMCSGHQSRDSPADRGEAAVPLQPMAVHRGAHFHLQPQEDPSQQRWRLCSMGSLRWSRLLEGPVTLWREEPMPEEFCWQDL
ncbi:hypothetical protein BTVI_69700 [Pitangus sulphuratus]|nr:hypothetical protein BTVI_69700 [Pitangus sulphuratus]